MRLALTIAVLLVAGTGSLWAATEGFSIITAEGARRLAIEQKPAPLPAATLTDQQGKTFLLQNLQGKELLVEFIYTRCATLCTSLGDSFEQIDRQLVATGYTDRVTLLSISFDPRDTVADLKEYGERYGADASRWRIARLDSAEELEQLLAVFGVTVIPDEWGNFEHNAAVHFVNPEGELDRIVDHDPATIAMETLWAQL